MRDWPLVHLDDGFWGRWAVAQGTVGSFCVVVFPPSFDDDLCFSEREEDLPVQQFVSEPRIEALDIAILSGRSRLDVGCLGTDSCDPVSDRLGGELGASVASNICRWPSQDEQIGQGVDHIG